MHGPGENVAVQTMGCGHCRLLLREPERGDRVSNQSPCLQIRRFRELVPDHFKGPKPCFSGPGNEWFLCSVSRFTLQRRLETAKLLGTLSSEKHGRLVSAGRVALSRFASLHVTEFFWK